MSMDGAAWRRHANPLSGWSRISVLPPLALAIYSRFWLGWWCAVPIAVVLVWVWANPRLFPEPRSVDNWMSQGVLGERIWLARKDRPIARHHEVATRILNAGASIGVVLLGIGLWLLDLRLTLAGVILSMGAKLWFLDRMAWLKSNTETSPFS